MAFFTGDDIQKEIDQSLSFQKQALQLLQPLQDELYTLKEDINQPFKAEAKPIHTAIENLQQEIDALYTKRYRLGTQFYHDVATLEKRRGQAIQEATSSLRQQLTLQRQQVLEEAKKLTAQKEDILKSHHHAKSDPYLSKLCDGIDRLSVGFNLATVEGQIKSLYHSVEGDLPKRIQEIEHATRIPYDEEYIEKEQALKIAYNKISRDIHQAEKQLSVLEQQASEIYQRQRNALKNAIPNLNIVDQLAEEVALRIITGLPI